MDRVLELRYEINKSPVFFNYYQIENQGGKNVQHCGEVVGMQTHFSNFVLFFVYTRVHHTLSPFLKLSSSYQWAKSPTKQSEGVRF